MAAVRRARSGPSRQTTGGNLAGEPVPPEDQPAVARENGAAAVVSGASTQLGETLPIAASVVRLEPGLYVVEIRTDAASSDSGDRAQPSLWVSEASSSAVRRLDILSTTRTGDQWLEPGENVVAVRASSDALLTATILGSALRPPLP